MAPWRSPDDVYKKASIEAFSQMRSSPSLAEAFHAESGSSFMKFILSDSVRKKREIPAFLLHATCPLTAQTKTVNKRTVTGNIGFSEVV
jgi:hypothetical protein